MRRWDMMGMMGMVVLALMMHSAAQADTREAEAAYAAGDYARAAALYEQVIAAGDTSARAYYNLGSAYFEADDLGRALLSFRRAHRQAPRDLDIDRGIALVRALRVDVQGDAAHLLDTVAAVTDDLMTTGEVAALAFALWAAFFALVVRHLLGPVQTRAENRAALRVVGVGMLVLLALLVGRVTSETLRPPAVVTAFAAQVMSGPGTHYVPLYGLSSGAELRMLETRGAWVRFEQPDGRQGWIEAAALEAV